MATENRSDSAYTAPIQVEISTYLDAETVFLDSANAVAMLADLIITRDHGNGIELREETLPRLGYLLESEISRARAAFRWVLDAYTKKSDQLIDDEQQGAPTKTVEPLNRTLSEAPSVERAIRAINRATRISEVCVSALRGIDVECSDDIAQTLGFEQQEALRDALEALTRTHEPTAETSSGDTHAAAGMALEALNVMYAVRQMVELVDPNAYRCADPSAVVIGIKKLLDQGIRELDQLEVVLTKLD